MPTCVRVLHTVRATALVLARGHGLSTAGLRFGVPNAASMKRRGRGGRARYADKGKLDPVLIRISQSGSATIRLPGTSDLTMTSFWGPRTGNRLSPLTSPVGLGPTVQ